MKKKITIVNADDWMGLYINGELVAENHSIEADDMLSLLNIEYESFWCDEDWIDREGRLPKNLKDVRRE